MRDRDLQTLEFDKVLRLLAACALSSAGQDACLSLRPHTDTERVEAESDRAWQFFRLLTEFPAFPLHAFPDVRPSLQAAAHEGATLTGSHLVEILQMMRLSRIVGSFVQRLAEGYETLGDLPTRLTVFPVLEEQLSRCLTSEGHLTDDASPELAARSCAGSSGWHDVRCPALTNSESVVSTTHGARMNTSGHLYVRYARFVLVTILAISGCFPAPRTYRIFLPPVEAKKNIEARLTELQQRCDRGDLTAVECARRQQELRAEMAVYNTYRDKNADRSE